MSENGKEPPKSNGTDVPPNEEPSESDPCMEGQDGKKTPFRRYRDEISARTGLSNKGVYIVAGIVILAFLLFIIVISLAAAWPRIPHKYQFPVCKEAECLRAAAQIQEARNGSVSPCENLWQSVCGGWMNKYPLPKDRSVWNLKQQLVKNEAERVRDLITTLPLPLHINTAEWKMKYLYENCMDMSTSNMDGDRRLSSIMTNLGGWYILRDFNEDDFDKFAILRELHVKYGVTPFFKISVEPHPNMPGHNAIWISPSGLGLPDREYYYREEDDRITTAYKEYIRDIVIYMSTARNEATKFATDMFSYEKRIAEITPERSSLLNPIKTFNAISLSELKETNLIPFYDIILVMFPDTQISDDTEVIISSIEYLGHIAQIISTTDRRTMNGYLMWSLVRTYIPFLPKKFTLARNTFYGELYGIQEPIPRWEMCAELVTRFMGLATFNLMERSQNVSQTAENIVTTAFNAIVEVVKTKLSQMDMTDLLSNYLKNKLSNLKMHIGIPKNFTSDRFMKNYYFSLKIMKSEMFQCVKNGMEFRKNLEQQRLNKISGEENILSYLIYNTPQVHYSPSDNCVVIPKRLLVHPFFEDHYPSSVIYGRLGVEIAEAVVSSIMPYNSLWTSDLRILSPFHVIVNESMMDAHKSTKCLAEYILNLNLDVPSLTANETALKTLLHLSAVKIANEALLSIQKTDHIHQPSLEEYEDSGLFFLTYAQTQCSVSTSQYQLYENIIDFQLPQQSRLYLLWTQLQEFSNSLGCSFNKRYKCPHIL